MAVCQCRIDFFHYYQEDNGFGFDIYEMTRKDFDAMPTAPNNQERKMVVNGKPFWTKGLFIGTVRIDFYTNEPPAAKATV